MTNSRKDKVERVYNPEAGATCDGCYYKNQGDAFPVHACGRPADVPPCVVTSKLGKIQFMQYKEEGV